MRFFLPTFVITTVLVASLGCDEVKKVRMMINARWKWSKNLTKRDSEEYKEKEKILEEIIRNATDPIIVCNVTVEQFYPSVYADTRVQFDRASYDNNSWNYDKVKGQIQEYIHSTKNRRVLRSVSSVISDGQAPTVLGVTFMCTVLEVLWQLL